MKFEENLELQFMVAKVDFKGREIEIRLTLHEDENYEEVGKQSVEYISEIWSDIEEAIIGELYELYIEMWSDNSPKYSKEDFLKKIYPETIDFDDYEDEECKPSYTMYFNDSRLFGGHGIQIYWDKGEKVKSEDVSLVG